MADWLHDSPWRQGHALTSESAKALGLSHPDSPVDTVAIVISHDCDLAVDVGAEPTCEVVIGRRIKALDGSLTNAKSIRRLHLTCSAGVAVSPIEIEIRNRVQLQKTDLADYLPDKEIGLSTHERQLLQAWLAARYNRPSFPDEFVTRLTEPKSYRKLQKKLADTSSHILMALFDLDEGGPDTERKGKDDVYTLSIYLVCSAEGDPEESNKVAERTAVEITKLFEDEFKKAGEWINIELVTCEPVSEAEVPLRMWRLTRRWYLDYISFRGGQAVANL